MNRVVRNSGLQVSAGGCVIQSITLGNVERYPYPRLDNGMDRHGSEQRKQCRRRRWRQKTDALHRGILRWKCLCRLNTEGP